MMARRKPVDPDAVVARVRRQWRLVKQDADPRLTGTDDPCWMVLDRTNSGHGVYGDEAAGRSNYEKHIMFRALEKIDAAHDWHEYDWHTLTGTAEERVCQMMTWRAEQEAAAAQVAGIDALVKLMIRGAGRECR